MPIPPLILGDDTSAPISHGGDAVVQGPVRSGRTVDVKGALRVEGDVGATRLSVGGVATIAGGISGDPASRYVFSGDLRCRSIRDAQIMARGDIHVTDAVERSRITCGGRIELPAGQLSGGDVAANAGITCRVLGHSAGVPTFVEVGEGRTLRLLTASIAAQIADRRQRAEVLRASIEPLMQNLKSLSPAQREKATEMLYQADELDAETARLEAGFEARRRLTLAHAQPRVAVSERIYPGVVIQAGHLQCVIDTIIDGPVTLLCRQFEGKSEIVAVTPASGVARPLPCRPIEPAAAA